MKTRKKIFFIFVLSCIIVSAQNGIVKSYYADGILRSEISFVNDVLDGQAFYYYPNGNLKSEKNFSNGVLEGKVKEFYDNGILKEEYEVRNGIKHGSYRLFYENGALKELTIYEGGRQVFKTNFAYDPYFITPVDLYQAGNRQQQIIKKRNQELICDVEECPVPIGGMKAIQDILIYPEHALLYGLEGTVTLVASINEKGEVVGTETIRRIGLGCEEAAIEAVKKTKFIPGRSGDRAVFSRVTLNIEFKIFDRSSVYTNDNSKSSKENPIIKGEEVLKPDFESEFNIKCEFEECPYPIDGIKTILLNMEIPSVAKRLKIKGVIVLEAEIDIFGIVRDTKVLKRIGYGCDEAFESAILKTKFVPAKSKGEIINSKIVITFPFSSF